MVIEELAAHESGLKLTEIADRTCLHTTTAHRILATLHENGFVDRNAESGRYRVGLKVLKIGHGVRLQIAPSAIVRHHLTELRDATGETTHYAVPAGSQMVYVEKVESQRSIRIASEIGTHLDCYRTALGKAYLAHRPSPEVEIYMRTVELERRTERTISTIEQLRRALETVRRQGFSLDDRENEPHIRCVGAAVLNPAGIAIGAVSASSPVFGRESDGGRAVARSVMECARAIAHDMFGGHP